MWELKHKLDWTPNSWCFQILVLEKTLEIPLDWKEIKPVNPKGTHRKDWGWSWSSNPLATWCEEPTLWKRLWCSERLKAGKGDDREWDGWMASLVWCTWVWASSGCWWWTGKPGVMQSMGLQKVRHDWTTKLNWTLVFSNLIMTKFCSLCFYYS